MCPEDTLFLLRAENCGLSDLSSLHSSRQSAQIILWSRTRTQSVPWCTWPAKHFSECPRFFLCFLYSFLLWQTKWGFLWWCAVSSRSLITALQYITLQSGPPTQLIAPAARLWASSEKLWKFLSCYWGTCFCENKQPPTNHQVSDLIRNVFRCHRLILALSDLTENSVKSVKLCGTTGAMCGHEIGSHFVLVSFNAATEFQQGTS